MLFWVGRGLLLLEGLSKKAKTLEKLVEEGASWRNAWHSKCLSQYLSWLKVNMYYVCIMFCLNNSELHFSAANLSLFQMEHTLNICRMNILTGVAVQPVNYSHQVGNFYWTSVFFSFLCQVLLLIYLATKTLQP